MVTYLELGYRQNDPDGLDYRLVLRDFNGIEVDRTQIFRMTRNQALSLAASSPMIRPGRGCPAFSQEDLRGATPAMLEILKVPDREPMTPPWEGRIAGVSVGRLTSDRVREICNEISPVFEAGQPDWGLSAIEDLEDRAYDHRRELGRLELRINELKQARLQVSEDSPAP